MLPAINLKKRNIGVNFNTDGKAEIKLWAPLAKSVELLLTKSNEKHALKEASYGYWLLTTDALKPDDLYQFVLDGKSPLPDPASLAQPETVHGPSQAIDICAFNWTDASWENFALKDYLFYELHTGTFTSEGTFAAIKSKLDYLKELGITAIEIMPVAQFPGGRNWGYDGVFPFAVQNTYGGAKGLQHLVDVCHQKGIAVVIDVVYNHMGPEGNYFGEFGPYFTKKYNTPWGNAINFDDEYCDAVRQYYTENVLMWFRDFHIDALRMDAVHAIKDFSAKHILREIKQEVNQLMAETGRKHHLIVELDLNDTRFINPLEKEGFGMDGQWIDEFHHALRVAAGGERTGYYSDFEGISHLEKAYRDAYVYDGIYSPHRKKTFGSKAEHNAGEQFVVFSQNHDQVGNRMLGERSSQLFSFEMQKLMAGAVMVSPFLPMLFMGEEYSETHPFLYFVSHTDPELAEAVRKGRKAEFAAFHAEGEAPDPVDEATFNKSKLQWDLLEQEPHATMLQYYKTLIALRKKLPALQHLNRQHLEVSSDENTKTLILKRWHENQQVLCLMNFSEEHQQVQLPKNQQQWHKVLASADPEWNGPTTSPETVDASAPVILQPESIIIYSN
ncbi:malto-oligosyltrehalose trehalohydrolase [Mucilaginibacter arboris]|uniref:Malto-oligosyltrehalose trehalohydrolase n=1 Tax=Mucilaginibacter arboris TaxID=2682090 RepID=A0A7K1SZR4_9SPHI|nr:malto-oligosyltrehalose trehalohydrolase [Mucilaginibacter arboris]MVN22758.1 malto-oligosyltrehalose trehalohydrolase [Mucilaginibacter arboris]